MSPYSRFCFLVVFHGCVDKKSTLSQADLSALLFPRRWDHISKKLDTFYILQSPASNLHCLPPFWRQCPLCHSMRQKISWYPAVPYSGAQVLMSDCVLSIWPENWLHVVWSHPDPGSTPPMLLDFITSSLSCCPQLSGFHSEPCEHTNHPDDHLPSAPLPCAFIPKTPGKHQRKAFQPPFCGVCHFPPFLWHSAFSCIHLASDGNLREPWESFSLDISLLVVQFGT